MVFNILAGDFNAWSLSKSVEKIDWTTGHRSRTLLLSLFLGWIYCGIATKHICSAPFGWQCHGGRRGAAARAVVQPVCLPATVPIQRCFTCLPDGGSAPRTLCGYQSTFTSRVLWLHTHLLPNVSNKSWKIFSVFSTWIITINRIESELYVTNTTWH